MVEATIRTVDKNVPYRGVTARRGKIVVSGASSSSITSIIFLIRLCGSCKVLLLALFGRR